MIIETILGGVAVALLVTLIALIRQVARLSGLVENGLSDTLERVMEEQARLGARIDDIYKTLVP